MHQNMWFSSSLKMWKRACQNNRMVAASVYVFTSEGGGGANLSLSFRPVVILESDVKINTEMEGKDGSTPENAFVIN